MKNLLTAILIGAAIMLLAQEKTFREAPEKYWDFEKLKEAPAFRDAPFEDCKAEGLRPVLVTGYGPSPDDKTIQANHPNGLDAKVKAEFFAYIGIPKGPVPEGGFPGIVLIHGGLGTAYPEYAQLFVQNGYAVISIDWYNQRPITKYIQGKSPTLVVKQEPLPGGKRQDHVANVANAVLAHSLLRSLENVNPDKTVFAGLSWGSWYGAMLAAVDPRFKGGVEIYCGYVRPASNIFINGRFLHAAKVPLYWVVGTNDQNARLEELKMAFEECPKLENKSIVIRLPHAHVGFRFASVLRMANHFAKGETGLPKLSDITKDGNIVSAKILDQGKGIQRAILCYTDSTEKVYHKQEWKSIPAKIESDVISAELPEGAHKFFLSAYDGESKHNDLCGSTSPVFIQKR